MYDAEQPLSKSSLKKRREGTEAVALQHGQRTGRNLDFEPKQSHLPGFVPKAILVKSTLPWQSLKAQCEPSPVYDLVRKLLAKLRQRIAGHPGVRYKAPVP